MDSDIRKKIKVSLIDDITFSSARILNLIYQIEKRKLNKFLRFEDLIYIDFFAAHPFLVFIPGQKEYLNLLYYGFSDKSLEYKNSQFLFSNQREKMKVVFSSLISKDIIQVKIEKKLIIYCLSSLGLEIAGKFLTDYYKSYQMSMNYILELIKNANKEQLKEFQNTWLSREALFAEA